MRTQWLSPHSRTHQHSEPGERFGQLTPAAACIAIHQIESVHAIGNALACGDLRQRAGGQSTTYFANPTYAPHGGFTQYEYGNGLWRQQTFNTRLQPYESWDATTNQPNPSTAETFLNLGWNWGSNVNNGILYGLIATHGGPGQPVLAFNESYAYDAAGRISQANDWKYVNGQDQTPAEFYRYFGYDQYGNMWVTGNSGVTLDGGTPTSDIYSGKNQMSSGSYDTAGNQTTFGTYALTYNADERQATATESPSYGGGSVTYSYDGNGRRVESATSGGLTTVFVYDAMGQLISQYSNGSEATPVCQTCYLSYDHLGSTRLVTDELTDLIARHDFLPFGEEVPANTAGRTGEWGPGDNIPHKFTGKVRDTDTQLDYSNARYLGATLGRFLSSDPGNAGADASNPESWNGYAYVGNSPLTFTDPSGLMRIFGGIADGYIDPDGCGGLDDLCDPTIILVPDPIIVGWGGGGKPPKSGTGSGTGKGTGSGSGSGNSGQTADGGPLPPGSFPGGENLGLPPGITLPGPFQVGTDPFEKSLAPSPVEPTIQSILAKILGVALSGPALALELILLNPSSAGGKSEIEFENASKRRYAISVQKYAGPQAATDPDCVDQWADAFRICQQPGRRRPGQTLEQCAAGYVDERCGGNEIDHSRLPEMK